jgi:hypothetical protein
MAEYCKDCFKKWNPGVDEHRLRMSREAELCEGCGQLRSCVERIVPETSWRARLSRRKAKQEPK